MPKTQDDLESRATSDEFTVKPSNFTRLTMILSANHHDPNTKRDYVLLRYEKRQWTNEDWMCGRDLIAAISYSTRWQIQSSLGEFHKVINRHKRWLTYFIFNHSLKRQKHAPRLQTEKNSKISTLLLTWLDNFPPIAVWKCKRTVIVFLYCLFIYWNARSINMQQLLLHTVKNQRLWKSINKATWATKFPSCERFFLS